MCAEYVEDIDESAQRHRHEDVRPLCAEGEAPQGGKSGKHDFDWLSMGRLAAGLSSQFLASLKEEETVQRLQFIFVCMFDITTDVLIVLWLSNELYFCVMQRVFFLVATFSNCSSSCLTRRFCNKMR